MSDISREQLIEFFPQLHNLLQHCQFSDCAHSSSSRGCRFYQRDAYRNEREQRIILSYLDSYQRLLSEL